jgi:ribosomal protein L29
MKTKEFKDLKTKSVKELKKMVSEKKTAIMKSKMQVFSGKEKNLKLSKNLRDEIAKILTLVKEKEIMEKLEGASRQ